MEASGDGERVCGRTELAGRSVVEVKGLLEGGGRWAGGRCWKGMGRCVSGRVLLLRQAFPAGAL